MSGKIKKSSKSKLSIMFLQDRIIFPYENDLSFLDKASPSSDFLTETPSPDVGMIGGSREYAYSDNPLGTWCGLDFTKIKEKGSRIYFPLQGLFRFKVLKFDDWTTVNVDGKTADVPKMAEVESLPDKYVSLRSWFKLIKDEVFYGLVKAALWQCQQDRKSLLDPKDKKTDEETPESFLISLALSDKKMMEASVGKLADCLAIVLMRYYAHVHLQVQTELYYVLNPARRLKAVLGLWDQLMDLTKGLENLFHVPVKVVDKIDPHAATENYAGSDDSIPTEIIAKFDSIKKRLPKNVKDEIKKEINNLKGSAPNSAESQVIKRRLEWILDLFSLKPRKENKDLKKIKKILDEDHYGLLKPKKRMVEYASVRILNPNVKGAILCYVGPPGVGKTSLGQSIARALNRKFVRISLGGVRDAAEIRGHRSTYIGALPGRIIQGLVKCGSSNPLFMLDEVDKLGNDFRGDPASALLEVLDPEQNFSFSDHYINLNYDLSKVFFIVTANTTATIPPALKDRLEILPLPGYTEKEKIGIAKHFLVPKQLRENGVVDNFSLVFSESALERIIREHTRETGVRNLEREIASVCRTVVCDFLEGKVKNKKRFISVKSIPKYLGGQKYFHDVAEKLGIGVATGLGVTQFGGDILFVEARTVPDTKGGLELTGQLGDVMMESCRIALDFLRSDIHADLENKIKQKIHIHVPKGAVPKDGPSAGLPILFALYSLFKKIPVKYMLAATGEITLRGVVNSVGGLKQKLIAADRAGIKEVIVPEKNRAAILDTPSELMKKIKKKKLQIHLVSTMNEALDLVFPDRKKKRKK